MNKLKILFGTLLVMASLLFVAYPIDTLPHPVCVANLKAPLQATAGQGVTFDASSSFCYLSGTSLRVPISNYAFKFGDGAVLNGLAPIVTHAFAASGSYSPSVTVTAQGWQGTATIGINVASATPNGANPYLYVPQPPMLPTPTLPNPTCINVPSILPNPTCINIPPIITAFNANPRFGVEPLTALFNGSAFDANGDPMTYVLFFDWNGNASKNTTGTIGPAVKILGNYTYSAGNWQAKMDVSDGKSKTSRTITFHVNASQIPNQPPVACMTASDTGGYLPFTITFNGSCSYDIDGNITYHTWKIEKENGPTMIEVPGNNSPETWQYTFTEEGKYFVYLKVADEQNETNETNVTIRAEQYLLGPVIGWFRGEPSSGYAPLTVSFKSSAVGIYPLTYTLFFSIDDRTKNVTGAINSTDSVLGNFLYISGGTFGKTYTTELVVSDPLNHTVSKGADVHVSPAWTNPNNSQNTCPMINFTYSPSEVFVGDEVQFTDQSIDSDGQIIYWIWQFGDGACSGDDLVSGEQNPKHVYSSAGNYTVSLQLYDNSGCANLTRQTIEAKEKIAPPQPLPSGGGGGGMYLGPPTPAVIIQTSGIGYLGFHPSYGLNGTRSYSFDNTTNITTITLRIVNLAKFTRNISIRDNIPKTVALNMQEMQIIPVPMTIFNQDPEIGWNVTLASKQAFEAKYIFKKYVPFSEFQSLPLPIITEITPRGEVPVSPEKQVTVAGGITGFVISAFSNPWVGAIVLVVILVFFFAFTETGRNSVNGAATRTRDFITSIMDDLEEPKEGEDKSERVKKLKKLMKKKRKG